MERVLGLEEVENALSTFYGLSHHTSKRWAEFCISKNLTWDNIHALANMAVYGNTDLEEVFKMLESWTMFSERTLNETKIEDSG